MTAAAPARSADSSHSSPLVALLILLLMSAPARAQEQAGQVMGTKKDRLFWLIPNYQTVDEQRSTPSISDRDKFLIAIKDSFDPFALPTAGLFAGIAQLQHEYPSWGRQGTEGYDRRFLAALADQTVSNMMAEGVFPVLLHQDPRFLRLGHGNFLQRVGYAATRVFITRGDAGGVQFNASEVAGNAVMAAASNLYVPPQDRSVADTGATLGIQLGVDMVGSVFREFWPDIKRMLLGQENP